MSDYHSQKPDHGFGDGSDGRERRSRCGADELKGLLQRIAAHIADADIRHGSVLQDMHGRLVHLGDAAQASRDTVPPALSAAFTRIEHGLADLAGRIDADQAPAHRIGQPGFSAHADDDVFWDRASAEALTRAYEVEADRKAPTSALDQYMEDYASAPIGGTDPQPMRVMETAGSARSHQDGHDASADIARRIGELAARLESVLTAMPTSALAALETRFNSFEQRLDTALDRVATRTDVEGLRLIEAHISELSQHIEHARSQLGRLDAVEHQLERVSESVADERLEKLINQAALSDIHLERLAGALAVRLEQSHEKAQSANEVGKAKLDELTELVEQFVSNYRQTEENTAGALGTVQQAMVHLLDRIDALTPEHAPWPSDQDALDREDDFSRRGEGEEALARVYHHEAKDAAPPAATRTGAAAPVAAAQAPAPSQHSPELAQIAAEINEARKAVRAQSAGSPEAAAASQSSTSPEMGTEAKQPLTADREEFIAAARRAARQASSLPTSPASSPAPSPRAVLGGRRKALARPLASLALAMLIAMLAVGAGVTTYSFIEGEPAATSVSAHNALRLQDDGAGADASPASDATLGQAENDSVLIGDEPPPGLAQDPVPPQTGSELPAGVLLETSSLYPSEQIAKTGPRQVPNPPNRLDAAQASVHSIPASLIPNSAGRPAADAPDASRMAQPQSLPPAAVGPLSLRIAAANGDPSAEFEVAARFAEGKGVPQDFKQAVTWYQRSASRGFAPAQYRLGTLYERGLGVKADLGRAKAWYRSAAEKGNIKAMHNLAVLSAGGASADYKTAAHWFTEAADRGVRDSQFNLAVLLENGIGVQQDLKAAYGWFAVAAQAGDKEATRRLEQLKHRLLPSETTSAATFARNWRAKPVDPLVNDARTAGEAWKLRDNDGVAGR